MILPQHKLSYSRLCEALLNRGNPAFTYLKKTAKQRELLVYINAGEVLYPAIPLPGY